MLQELYEQYLRQKKVLRDLATALDQRTVELRQEVRLELEQQYQRSMTELAASARSMKQQRLAIQVRPPRQGAARGSPLLEVSTRSIRSCGVGSV